MAEEAVGGEESPTVYGWSTYPDEDFVGAFATEEEALEDAYKSVGKDNTIYVQAGYYEDVTVLVPTGTFYAEQLIEHLGENSYELCGELAESWPDVSAEAEKELADAIEQTLKTWMKKHLKMPAWHPHGEPKEFLPKEET